MTVFYAVINRKGKGASYTVIVDTTCGEYISLVLISIITKKSSFRNFFADLAYFDKLMNLSDDLKITSPSARGWGWIAASVFYSFGEFLILWFLSEITDYSFVVTYITLVAHDCEQVYFCSLLRMILMRVYVMKAHVVKTFSSNNRDAKRKLSKIEALSKKAQLDISSLHRNYELLHKCSEQLNSIMSLPMGKGMIAYASSRCLRYTVMVIIPCYYSSVTTTQVSYMRTMLHDAMNQVNIGKVDRRRVKAFFQLTRENEFAYAIWGVIRLNMSLPLSYLSLCTTYLVIIIQFAKFID
ncbi:hypothetical protein ABMA28_001469 [Loxostege sticticalis]|uniref:Gustatory receptor n=1 Tax=Loxostege sticticalis TaxID=481309 RepID=A0ABD0T1S6_LOXSC